MVNVLIVDDSSFARHSIEKLLKDKPDINIVGSARNGEEALKMFRELDPDVITLDVEMPGMSGLNVLEIIMNENPCPVIMVSSLTTEGAEVTFKALDLGALDYIPKQALSSDQGSIENYEELASKILILAKRKKLMRLMFKLEKQKSKVEKNIALINAKPVASSSVSKKNNVDVTSYVAEENIKNKSYRKRDYKLVVIGVSTGGPSTLQSIIPKIPADFPVPIVIAQHMPSSFTGLFAKRLNERSKINVLEVTEDTILKPGNVYIAQGGKHIFVKTKGTFLLATMDNIFEEEKYKPSVNVLFSSASKATGKNTFAVILTGMGNDGLEGAKEIKNAGGYIVAQDEESCVVYGMPKVVVEAKLADEVLGVDEITKAIGLQVANKEL